MYNNTENDLEDNPIKLLRMNNYLEKYQFSESFLKKIL
jgi:hypothetical protein